MGDEKSLLSVSIDPSVEAARQAEIIAALSAEQQRVMRAFACVLVEYDDDSEYGQIGYQVLQQAMPEMTDSLWRAVTGTGVPDGSCREYPSQCCGYCWECDAHHEDSNEHSKCMFGYCHECEHKCD